MTIYDLNELLKRIETLHTLVDTHEETSKLSDIQNALSQLHSEYQAQMFQRMASLERNKQE